MDASKFTEEDEKKLVEALNFIATEGKFGEGPSKVDYSIKLYRHFAFLQSLVGKVHNNIMEIKALHLPKEDKKQSKKAK